MSNLVKNNNQDLQVKEFNGQRVVTFKDIDILHERVEGTANRNFRENKKHFKENEDYFFVKPSNIQTDEIRRSEINNAGTYLITESGYLMLAKSLQDDLAWKVQRELVNFYFKGQQLTKFQIKDSKAGGLNGFLKTLNSVMKEEDIAAWQRAEVIKDVAEQCGVKIPDSFVQKPLFMQITLNVPLA